MTKTKKSLSLDEDIVAWAEGAGKASQVINNALRMHLEDRSTAWSYLVAAGWTVDEIQHAITLRQPYTRGATLAESPITACNGHHASALADEIRDERLATLKDPGVRVALSVLARGSEGISRLKEGDA